ncbi:MAG: hypothetical protein AAF297_07365 [Planctomycetota bacterium]
MIEPKPSKHRRGEPVSVRVDDERDAPRGWLYTVRIARRAAGESVHEVSLSWADHDQMTGGAASPSRLVASVCEVLVEARGEEPLPERFDVATVRRWVPDLAQRVGMAGLG